MTDIVDKETRSRMMSSIKGKDTKLEVLIAKELHKRGLRYRKHYKKLPGKPDLVFPKYKAIVLINGCFWHGHGCHLFTWPSTRREFWEKKITDTQNRDLMNLEIYKREGWSVFTLWECSLRGTDKMDFSEVVKRIEKWVRSGEGSRELPIVEGNVQL